MRKISRWRGLSPHFSTILASPFNIASNRPELLDDDVFAMADESAGIGGCVINMLQV